jgi:isoleucyl-tRNA synthetase
VHSEATYSIIKLAKRSGFTIVAKDRIPALADVIGSFDSVADIPGSDLVGLPYDSPFLAGATFNIIPSPHVTMDSGTGLVHCAPAHGMEDYNVFQSLGLDQSNLLCHVDGEGKFTQEVASVTGEIVAKSLVGLDILKGGSKAMVELLRDSNALFEVKKIKHRYPYDWKTGEPVIIMYARSDAVPANHPYSYF